MSIRVLWKLVVLCGLAGLILAAPQPAQAQLEPACPAPPPDGIVEPETILACLRAGQPVQYDRVTVNGDLDLTSLRAAPEPDLLIPVELSITHSRFAGALLAFNSDNETVMTFARQVDLRGSQFAGAVDFTGASFQEFAHFENVRFEAGALFNQATFQKGASFRATQFNLASFMQASLSGGLDFSQAQFSALANFSRFQSTQDPQARADVLFSGAQFAGGVFFMEAEFENPVYFDQAVFRRGASGGVANFSLAAFTTLNFSGADFENEQLDLNGTRYTALLMDNFQPALLPPYTLPETLTTLKDNFRRQGRLDSVNAIDYWQYGTHRREKPTLTQILETIFLDWTFGYGLKPLNAVWTSLSLILFFAVFYYPEGILRPAAFVPSKPRERRFTIRLTEIPIAPDEEAAESPGRYQRSLPPQVLRAWRAIVFSFGVFTKLSSGSYVAVRASSLVIGEWIIGLMVMAGFLFSLANTNPLLRSLLDLLK